MASLCLPKRAGQASSCLPRMPTLAHVFRTYVRLLVSCPVLFMALAFLIPCFLASFLLWGSPLRIDTDPNLIWVPPGSTTFRQKALFDAAFDPFFRVNQVFLTLNASTAQPAPGDEGQYGVLQPQYFQAVLQLQTALNNSASSSGITLDDVCFRLEKGGPCLVETPLNYFWSLPEVVLNLTADNIQHFVSCAAPNEMCASCTTAAACNLPTACSVTTIPPSFTLTACVKDGVPVIPEVVLGGKKDVVGGPPLGVCGEPHVRAESLVITLLLDSTPGKASDAAEWEREVFLPLVQAFAPPGLTASYMAERSISDALEIVDQQNQFVVVVSYAAMFVYIILALGKFPHPLAMRSSLGLQGIIIVLLSVLSSLGLWTMAGGHITMIVNEVVPFLILAIGVDNMFIVTRAFDRRWWGPLGSRARLLRGGAEAPFVRPRAGSLSAESSVTCGVDAETALSEALAEVGPTISAAAVCEIVAFTVGVTMNIPALTQFCAVAAIAVAIDFVLQVFWFVPAILLDAWRQELRRVDMAPCITLRGPGEPHTRCSPCCARSEKLSSEVVDALGYGASGMGMDVGLDRGYARFGPWQDAARAAMERHMAEKAAALQQSSGSGGHGGRPGAAGSLQYDSSATAFAATGSSSSRSPSSLFSAAFAATNSFLRLSLPPSQPSLLSMPPFGSSPRLMDDSPDPDTDTLLEAYGVGGDEPGGPPAPTTPRALSLAAVGGSGAGGEGEGEDEEGAAVLLLQQPQPSSPRPSFTHPPSPPRTPSRMMGGAKLRPLPLKPTGCLCLSPFFWGIANRGNFVRRFMSHYYIPVLLAPASRALVLLTWLGLLVVGVLSLGRLKLGLEQQLILPTGSYLSPYFDALAHQGDAGPPAYLVLQNVNYTHPSAFTNISNLAIAVGSLTSTLVPPVYSWVSDYQQWIEQVASSQGLDPVCNRTNDVPNPATASLAANVAYYIYSTHVTSDCCQAKGFCGGQYATDVQFYWGKPKQGSAAYTAAGSRRNSSSSSSGWGGVAQQAAAGETSTMLYFSVDGTVLNSAPGAVTRVGLDTRIGGPGTGYSSPHAFASRTLAVEEGEEVGAVIDDGGCDMSSGYVSHKAVLAAHTLAHGSSARLSHSLSIPHAAAAAAGFPSQLLAGTPAGASVPLIPCHILISRLRAQHRPLRNQSDFIAAKQVMQTALSSLQGSLPVISDWGLLGLQPPSDSTPPAAGAAGPFTDDTHSTWLPAAPGGAAFPYSLIYVYYEQYSYIRGVALTNLTLAVLAVFFACLLVSSLAVALTVLVLVSSLTLCVCGWTWALNPHGTPDPYGSGPYGVDVNAVFVVNLITATGLGVEFLIHITASYLENIATERERQASKAEPGAARALAAARRAEDAAAGCSLSRRAALWWGRVQWLSAAERTTQVHGALVEMGSSVVTGITFTKLVGVLILARAPSMLFRLYYFRIYLGIIVMGAFHGLALVPVLLATFGLPEV